MNLQPVVKNTAKKLAFPGFDLNTRCRYKQLTKYFRPGQIDTLDAGFGNGAFSYAAYKKGNRVLGISISKSEVEKAKIFYSFLGTDESRLQFKHHDIYRVKEIDERYDQIICFETLEHISKDRLIVQHFYDILQPNGVLHLCCPYALHPDHNLGRINGPEDGGHVRDGYTRESYQNLLEPVGFDIVKHLGVGSPPLVKADKVVRVARNKYNDWVAFPLFALTYPIQKLDYVDPEMPYSVYVQAVK